MPKTLLKYWIPLASLGLGLMGGVYGNGIRVGQAEQRITGLERQLTALAEMTCATQTQHDERIRATEAATALIPGMATDLREIRIQVADMMTLLVEEHQN